MILTHEQALALKASTPTLSSTPKISDVTLGRGHVFFVAYLTAYYTLTDIRDHLHVVGLKFYSVK